MYYGYERLCMHTHMGHNIGPYAYGISHTRMGRPIRDRPIYAYGADHWQTSEFKLKRHLNKATHACQHLAPKIQKEKWKIHFWL